VTGRSVGLSALLWGVAANMTTISTPRRACHPPATNNADRCAVEGHRTSPDPGAPRTWQPTREACRHPGHRAWDLAGMARETAPSAATPGVTLTVWAHLLSLRSQAQSDRITLCVTCGRVRRGRGGPARRLLIASTTRLRRPPSKRR